MRSGLLSALLGPEVEKFNAAFQAWDGWKLDHKNTEKAVAFFKSADAFFKAMLETANGGKS